ncbi:hypothetical protein M406DRAFT_256598 [Cryphonectria parasitica EP155]|uniref:Uncharacterized protein n=1 Tax=Cryphonectria parasitica (strain ATCC 38755 / EP155) TaxID=660469 RepID=A0A9P4Y455_CRYP1|nr:uncharacterized protein M406DRAFT_256598 [Cryphonectria parasitica EP155]KAF3766306.1 hypothetical protein M406DRAFT_256598 [Cryphonectria parasitica EP155]
MYGSYGSYSSTPAMEIPSRSNTYRSSASLDASCAFPSWPRRDSLGDDHHTPRASSYISDEDLAFLSEPVFADEDSHSVSSYGSQTPSPQLAPVRHITDEEIEEMRREQAMRQREYIAVVMREKEQRRRAKAAKQAKKGSSSSSSSSSSRKGSSPQPKSKLSAMTPIAE